MYDFLFAKFTIFHSEILAGKLKEYIRATSKDLVYLFILQMLYMLVGVKMHFTEDYININTWSQHEYYGFFTPLLMYNLTPITDTIAKYKGVIGTKDQTLSMHIAIYSQTAS